MDSKTPGATFDDFFWDGVFSDFLRLVFPAFIAGWGIGAFTEKSFPKFVYKDPKGPLWELNRQTGQVKLYHHPEKTDKPGEVDSQAPFHEWEGYMLSLPDQQGFLWYRLVLVHKTREWALPLNQLVPATTNREDVFAYWDLIRQYMDVTQPLPDIPLFEAYRHLDPTTAEHDRKKGRDPRYWFNMDDDSYAAFKKENMRKLFAREWN